MSKITFADFGDLKINVEYVIGLMFDPIEKYRDDEKEIRGNCCVYIDTDDMDLKRLDIENITRDQFNRLADKLSGNNSSNEYTADRTEKKGLGKVFNIRKKLSGK